VTRRLLLSYLTVAAIVLVVLEVPLAIVYQQRETGRLTVDVERDATALASFYEDGLEQKTALDPQPARTYASRTHARVVVVDAAGASLIDTAGRAGRDFATRPEIKGALAGRITTGVRHSNTLGTDLLYVAIPAASGGTVHGAVRVTMDTHAVSALVHRFWLGLAAVTAVVLAAMAAIGWTIARSVNRPLRQLHGSAARFASGDLTTGDHDPDAPPEIAALGETMNTMARRLDQLLAEHRAFVADASHQLRTPLTALRLRLENLQNDLDGSDTAEDLNAAIEETDRLSVLVGDLLKLARAEQSAAPEPVDLVRIARERLDTWSAFADAAGITLGLISPDGPVSAIAVPTGVEQIMDNLIDNAVAASPPESDVVVTVTPGRDRHRIFVTDQGPGLSDELKQRALDRFWRLDNSQPGTGLGLPIARALAEASGGSLDLADASCGGLAVSITLPAADSPARPATRRERSPSAAR
jgi:signal transduction histidine kinase